METFWQKTQLRQQPEKNTVPEPLEPLIGGSSQWCGAKRATRGKAPAPQ
ncbi:hypothetical protein LJC42_00580 [Eubacteriales bacterium OttesenSCG-928-K08]|nr:hypothetical protein [Eubacteriales bacterium OttesenSCG-928-K08]